VFADGTVGEEQRVTSGGLAESPSSIGVSESISVSETVSKALSVESGSEWIVHADLRDLFGSADHEKLLALVSQRVADSRVLRLIQAMLKAGS
jgi:RNA-directed DNA polymerase